MFQNLFQLILRILLLVIIWHNLEFLVNGNICKYVILSCFFHSVLCYLDLIRKGSIVICQFFVVSKLKISVYPFKIYSMNRRKSFYKYARATKHGVQMLLKSKANDQYFNASDVARLIHHALEWHIMNLRGPFFLLMGNFRFFIIFFQFSCSKLFTRIHLRGTSLASQIARNPLNNAMSTWSTSTLNFLAQKIWLGIKGRYFERWVRVL